MLVFAEGGEAGLRVIADGQLTDPKKAERFMRETGATLLAPVRPISFVLPLFSSRQS